MKRKLLSLLLCAVLALGVLPAPAFAGYENFTEYSPIPASLRMCRLTPGMRKTWSWPMNTA